MARSHAVWVLMQVDRTANLGLPVAAFTVKHELMTWLDRNRWQWSVLRLYRMLDGPNPVAAYREQYEEPTVQELDIWELMK